MQHSYAISPDGRQSDTARAIQRGASRILRASGFAVLPEMSLANGRRADLCAVGPDGEIWIIEIKSSARDFLSDTKWPEYHAFCDKFFFAVAHDFDIDLLPAAHGLILADAWGAELVRHPDSVALSAARRKAMLLRFARHAALRLHGLHDPAP